MPINREKLKQNAAKSTSQYVFSPGPNYFRVLPRSMKYFTEGDDDFVYKYPIHYIPTLGDESTRIVCPSRENKPCPVCMISKALYGTNNPDDTALAKKMYRRFRYIMNVCKLFVDPTGAVDMNRVYTVEPLDFSQKKVYDGLVMYIANEKWGELLDPVEGRNFCITMIPKEQSESGYNEYQVMPEPTITKIKLAKSWKKTLDALKDNIPPISSYDEILTALLNTGLWESVDEMPRAVQTVFKRELKESLSVIDPVAEDDIPDFEPPEPEPEEEAEPEQETQEAADDGKPDCFGVEYRPKKAKCKQCEWKAECIEKFLESDE